MGETKEMHHPGVAEILLVLTKATAVVVWYTADHYVRKVANLVSTAQKALDPDRDLAHTHQRFPE